MYAALVACGGDVRAVAQQFGAQPASVYQAARRYGRGVIGAKTARGVHLSDAQYLSLVRQATSAGQVWADAERIIASLTRHVEELAARVADYEGGA